MDIRKVKKLIELLEESNIDEFRISKTSRYGNFDIPTTQLNTWQTAGRGQNALLPHHTSLLIQANRDKLAQVFINLIENSFSFAPLKSNLFIDLLIEDDNAVIYIADQGKGINMNVKEKIFERFYTDRSYESGYHSGLGLSISKKIMESFFGSIELSNNHLKNYNGACFKLKLPLKD